MGLALARLSRLSQLRIGVIGGLLAAISLSPRLWLSARFYPLTPVLPVIQPFPAPADVAVLAALMVLLMVACMVPRREIFVAIFVLLALMAAQDQSRWQPWFYQYVVMLMAIALAGPKREPAALNTCRLAIVATYFWSGVAKLNPNFISNTFPWLIGPLPRAVQPWALHLAFLAPLAECGIAVGLLFRRSRAAAVSGAIAMHVVILAAIGPLGLRTNSVVWPWNLAMIAFLWILFVDHNDKNDDNNNEPLAPRDIVWGSGFGFQKVVLVLLGFMPVLSYFNLWDHYLSSALYSGNRTIGSVYVSDDVFERLPEAIADYVHEDQPDRSRLNIAEWSLGELNVPVYPEPRIYRNIARHICRYAIGGTGAGAGVELVIQGQLALMDSGRRSVANCASLGRDASRHH